MTENAEGQSTLDQLIREEIAKINLTNKMITEPYGLVESAAYVGVLSLVSLKKKKYSLDLDSGFCNCKLEVSMIPIESENITWKQLSAFKKTLQKEIYHLRKNDQTTFKLDIYEKPLDVIIKGYFFDKEKKD